MNGIGNTTCTACIWHINLNCLQTFALTGCSRLLTIYYIIQPSMCLYMCRILEVCIIGAIFTNELDLDCFKTLRLSGRSTLSTILYPVCPAVSLSVYTIYNVIHLSKLSGQTDLDCFETFCLSGRSTFLAVLLCSDAPTIGLHMCLVFHATGKLGLHPDLDRLQTFRLSRCTGYLAVFSNAKSPAIRLTMYCIINICICTCRFRCARCISCLYQSKHHHTYQYSR